MIRNISSFPPVQIQDFQDLEKRVEAFLGIKDKSVQPELEESEFLRKFGEAWQSLALAKDLQFKWGGSPKTVQQITGPYRGGQFNLSAAYDEDQSPVTKLTLSKPDDEPGPLDNEPLLTASLMTRLLNPGRVRYRLGGNWEKDDGDCSIDKSQVVYALPGFETDTEYLQFLMDALYYLWHFYPQILAQPHEIVPVLQSVAANKKHPTQSLARRLLNDLIETTQPLQDHLPQLLCRHCWHHFTDHTVSLSPLESTSYFGCRACHRTQEYVTTSHIIVVLDEMMDADYRLTEQEFRINWLSSRTLFDFDEVEIGQITDEAVERFVVQLGNDTDPVRASTYVHMRCTFRTGHNLTENTLRLLKQRFASVVTADY